MSQNQSEVPTMIEMLGSIPAKPKRERLWKTLHDKMPGHIATANDRANFSGCRYIRFGVGQAFGLEAEDDKLFAEQMKAEFDEQDGAAVAMPEEMANLYFSTRANLLVLEKGYDEGMLVLTVTTQLDEDDLEEMQEFQHRVNVEMEEWHQDRYERQQKQSEEAAEQRRLARVGKLAEDHNLSGQLRKLQEENASLKRQLDDLEAGDE